MAKYDILSVLLSPQIIYIDMCFLIWNTWIKFSTIFFSFQQVLYIGWVFNSFQHSFQQSKICSLSVNNPYRKNSRKRRFLTIKNQLQKLNHWKYYTFSVKHETLILLDCLFCNSKKCTFMELPINRAFFVLIPWQKYTGVLLHFNVRKLPWIEKNVSFSTLHQQPASPNKFPNSPIYGENITFLERLPNKFKTSHNMAQSWSSTPDDRNTPIGIAIARDWLIPKFP